MSKTYVALETLMAVVNAGVRQHPGLLSIQTDLARWIKVQGPNGKIYLPKAKKAGTVHVSGFRVETGFGVRDFDENERPTGKVTQELDFRMSEADILANLEGLVEMLAATVKPEKAPVDLPIAADQADGSGI